MGTSVVLLVVPGDLYTEVIFRILNEVWVVLSFNRGGGGGVGLDLILL